MQRWVRGWVIWFMATLLCGCIYGRTEQRLANGLQKMQGAMGRVSPEPRLLIYRVNGHGGRWVHEVLLHGQRYAERRTRSDGRQFAFGFDRDGAWLSVDGKDAIAADGSPWDALARTRAAIYQLTFAAPKVDDDIAYMGRNPRRWELAYRPAGGKTLNLSIDRRHHMPREMDWVDEWTRLVQCDRLAWRSSPDGVVLGESRCGAGNAHGDGSIASDERRLLSMQGMSGFPKWSAPKVRRSIPTLGAPVATPITNPHRIRLPVRINGRPPESIVLDSGATHTVLSEDVAIAAGVTPTGEPPLFVDPPFLERSELWVGVIDTLRVGDAQLHGQRVLVAKNPKMLGKEKGVLGVSFFRAFVVDVDSPARVVRLHNRSTFQPARDQKRVRLLGSRPRLVGEIRDVATGHVLLDTGMPDNIVVSAPMMSVRHKRQRGTDAHLGAQDGSGASPNYFTSIRGLRLGPLTFPRMGAVGRDRERGKLGIGVAAPPPPAQQDWRNIELGPFRVHLSAAPARNKPVPRANTGKGIAIVGMGVMRYARLSFDLSRGFVFVSTGDAYATLIKVGVDIERGPRGPTISRVVKHGPGDRSLLGEGDVVIAVDGQPVSSTDDALARIRQHHGHYLPLVVERHERQRHVVVDVTHPLTKFHRW